MGIVENSTEAKNSKCDCVKLDPDRPATPENVICHVPGIIGWTSDKNEIDYCNLSNSRPASEEYRSHIKKFKEMAGISDVCLEEGVENTWACVEREAKKRQ